MIKEAILESSAEHFNSVLNRPSNIIEDAIERLPQIEFCEMIYNRRATREAIQQLSYFKAPGVEAIPAEVC